MPIPIGTDAPLYHRPYGTIGMILANSAFSTACWMGHLQMSQWMLTYGRGLHPLQWVTSNFVHADICHLVGNMIFLLTFGMIVEGKIGWLRFTAVYLTIGIVECAIEQTLFLGSYPLGGSLGASTVIFGLMAIALVWAPRNEITLVLIVWYRPYEFELTVLAYSMWHICWQVYYLIQLGFSWGSEMLHLAGVAVGLPIGIIMLKKGWVECENWDIFSVLRGTNFTPNEYEPAHLQKAKREPINFQTLKEALQFDSLAGQPEENHGPRMSPAKSLLRIRELLAENKETAAFREYENMSRIIPNWHLAEQDLVSLANGLYRAGAYAKAAPLIEKYLREFDKSAPAMRMKLAGIKLQVENRPKAALRLLEPLAAADLTPKLESAREKIVRRAQELLAAGTIELSECG